MNGDLAIVMWIMALMGLADLLIRLFFGLSGNYWYMRTCVSRVKRLRSKKPDMFPAELTAAGGTSFLLGASAYAHFVFLLAADFHIDRHGIPIKSLYGGMDGAYAGLYPLYLSDMS